MVTAAFLNSPAVRTWLDGVLPAWTLLDHDSVAALRYGSGPRAQAIRLARDLSPAELAQSAVTRNTLVLLRAASAGAGLKLTAAGNLSRAVVAEMVALFEWPAFDRDQAFRLLKVINEPDFTPLFFVRHLAQTAGLVRRRKGHLRLTQAGRQAVQHPPPAMQALLFNIAFRELDLGYFGLNLQGNWPQADLGIVLWSLSVAANDWESSQRLTRLCTIPNDGVVAATWDVATAVTNARMLQPLMWFGLLEHREERVPGQSFGNRFYRKAPLFDRFLAFDVALEMTQGRQH